jgi:hypothetical protein
VVKSGQAAEGVGLKLELLFTAAELDLTLLKFDEGSLPPPAHEPATAIKQSKIVTFMDFSSEGGVEKRDALGDEVAPLVSGHFLSPFVSQRGSRPTISSICSASE